MTMSWNQDVFCASASEQKMRLLTVDLELLPKPNVAISQVRMVEGWEP